MRSAALLGLALFLAAAEAGPLPKTMKIEFSVSLEEKHEVIGLSYDRAAPGAERAVATDTEYQALARIHLPEVGAAALANDVFVKERLFPAWRDLKLTKGFCHGRLTMTVTADGQAGQWTVCPVSSTGETPQSLKVREWYNRLTAMVQSSVNEELSHAK